MSALSVIRESILTGALRPGQQLVQAEIAAQMNISRAPIREALRQLEEEGLVESTPYRGTFVSSVTTRDIVELYSLRGTLESMAARLLISHKRDSDVEELEAILARMMEAADTGDRQALNVADIEFHTLLCVLSDHRHLIRSWKTSANLIRRILSFRNRLSTPHVVVDMHKPIVEAIRNGNATAAQQAIEAHCLDSGDALAARWPEDEADLSREVAQFYANPGN